MHRYSKEFKQFADLYGTGIVRRGSSVPTVFEMYFESSLIRVRGLLGHRRRYKNNAGGEMRLEAGFIINDRERNAVCRRVGDAMCCGLYSTLPFHFFEIISSCMCYTEFLPFLGDSAPIRDVRSMLPDWVIYGFAPEYFLNTSVHKQFLEMLSNRNRRRDAIAVWMMDMMLDFCWCHELGHATLGHPDYLSEKVGLNAVSESAIIDLSAELQHERIQLEKQADAAAFSVFLELEQFERDVNIGLVYGLNRNQVCAIRLLCAFLLIYSWIWNEFRSTSQGRFEKVKARNHPPAVVRYELWLRLLTRFSEEDAVTPQLLTLLDSLYGHEPGTIKPTRVMIDAKTLKEGFSYAGDQILDLGKLHASFEGLEYFRRHLNDKIWPQSNSDEQSYKLFGKIISEYSYH